MTLDDLFTRLARGELSNLSMAEGGSIADASKDTLVQHANDALTRLYTRFPIKTDNLFLMQSGYITRYHLVKRYAQSSYTDGNSDVLYIQDTAAEPFNDDVLKVVSVYNGYGCQLPLNKSSRPDSLFTPQPKLLQVPHPKDGLPLAVQYQARHPTLVLGEGGPDIELPEFLTEALTAFIAHKVFSYMNTQESTAKAQEHLSVFDTICVEVVNEDLVTLGTATGSVRFHKNGWV